MTNQLRYQTILKLKITRETLNKQMEWLLNHKWLTYNSKSENYKLNGFKIIHRKTGYSYKTSVVWDDYEINKFEGFVDAAIISFHAQRKSYLNNKNRDQNRSNNVSGVKIGRTHMRDIAPVYDLPVRYLAKIMKISVASIVRMKTKAFEGEFIKIRKMFEKTNVPIEHVKAYREYSLESEKIVIHNEKVCLQLPDQFTTQLLLKRKRNLR